MADRFPAVVKAALVDAGWRPNRLSPVAPELPTSAKLALGEFGGLSLETPLPALRRNGKPTYRISFDPAPLKEYADAIDDATELTGSQVSPIAVVGQMDAMLTIDPEGKVFQVLLLHTGSVSLAGLSLDDAVIGYFTGRAMGNLSDGLPLPVSAALRSVGWMGLRGNRDLVRRCEKELASLTLFQAAGDAISLYGGLRLEQGSQTERVFRSFDLDPLAASNREDEVRIATERFGTKFYPLGKLIRTGELLVISEAGKVLILGPKVWLIGDSIEFALEYLISGRRASHP